MEVELRLDMTGADPGRQAAIERLAAAWQAEWAPGRQMPLTLSPAEKGCGFRLDLGRRDAVTALQDLHSRLYPFGVQVFVRFRHATE